MAHTFTMSKPRYDKTLFKALGRAITSRREQIKLSIEEFADRTSLEDTYIRDIEGGLRNLNLSTLSKLCRALGYTLSELFAEVETLAAGPEAPAESRDS